MWSWPRIEWKQAAALPLLATLVGCGARDHAPAADDGGAALEVGGAPRTPALAASQKRPVAEEGTLLISTRADAPSYLTSISAVARDREGKVLAGAETLQPSAGSIREASQLALALPAGERFGLELHARTSDPKPAECEASVGSLAVEAGASAQLRMLAWRCAERTGYVPPSVDATCYWLVDWLSVAQSDASVGVEVRTRVQPSPALEREPTILWAAEPASVGHFIQPSAADTSFVCDEGGREVILHVRADTGDCAEQLSVPFFCGD